MNPLVVSYLFSAKKVGLSIRLDRSGSPADRVQELHQAVGAWARDARVSFVPEISAAPLPGAIPTDMDQYLFADGAFNPGRLGRHLSMLLEDGQIHRYSIRPGAPMEGRDLMGREDVIAELRDAAAQGRSCHLRAPRRYGKTSVLKRLQNDLGQSGRPCLFADLSPGTSVAWFWVTLAQSAASTDATREAVLALPELTDWPAIGAAPSSVGEASRRLASRLGANPWSFGQRLLAALAQVEAALLLDEFSVFLRASMQEDEQGLRQLARMLQASRRASPATRQILSGSAGLAKYILFHGLESSFDDLHPVELPPFSEARCRELAEELLYGAGVSPMPDAVTRLAELGGPVPYFIHLLADAVVLDHRSGPLAQEQVDLAYRERVLGPWANASFRAFSLGHQPYPHGLRRVATDLLRLIAREADGATLDSLRKRFEQEPEREIALDSLLACLQEDFDLVQDRDRLRMRCRPLRDRWALQEGWLTEGA